jgi:hypothetical protein
MAGVGVLCDFRRRLIDCEIRLIDSGNSAGDQVANPGSGLDRCFLRYSLGVMPAVILKARLNGASD